MSDLSYMAGKGYSRGSDASKEQVNQHTGHLNDGRLVNFKRGPTTGNMGTKKAVMPPQCHTPKVTPGKDMFMASSNPQVRNPGGTRNWEPKSGQNYRGDANRINVGRGPTKGNQL